VTERAGVPAWMIGVFLLIGSATIVLLANHHQLIEEMRLSWPLLISLVGFSMLIWNFSSYLIFAGTLLATGLFVYLHNIEKLPLRTNWPWILVTIGVLIAIDRLLGRSSRVPRGEV